MREAPDSGLMIAIASRRARELPRTGFFALVAALLCAIAGTAAAQSVTLNRSHPDEVAQFKAARPTASYRQLEMKVVIALRNQPALDKLLGDQQDPAAPDYHRWLTPEEFTARFGPDERDLAALAQWLDSEGFTVTSRSVADGYLGFHGTVAQAERLFGVTIVATADDRYYGNQEDPIIPARFAGLITKIEGLDNLRHYAAVFRRHRVRGRLLESRAAPLAPIALVEGAARSRRVTPATEFPDFPPAFAPGDVYEFYDENSVLSANINGQGSDCIALIEDSDYSTGAVNVFDQTFLANAPALNISETFPTTDPGKNGDESETLLDIQWAHAIAPGAAIRVYAGNQGNARIDPITDGIKKAVKENKCSAISISFTECGDSASFFIDTLDPIFKQAASQGQSVFVSAGDDGAAGLIFDPALESCAPGSTASVNELSSDPYVTSVGGTQFNPVYDDSGNDVGFVPEQVWDEPVPGSDPSYPGDGATGGGVSSVYAKPSYQQGVSPADGRRDVPDIAAIASNDMPGVYFGDDPNDPGSFCTGAAPCVTCCEGGTSLSAPMWAGISRLIAQTAGGRLGSINPRIYQLGASENTSSVGLRDVVSGNNDYNGVTGFAAGPGYDLVSGWGTPDIAQLIAAFPTQTLALSAAAINFPAVGIDTAVVARSFKISNSGIGLLTGTLDLSALPAAFSLAKGTGASFSLAHNESVKISVDFAPTAVGVASGSIAVDSNDFEGRSPALVAVSGTGASGTLAVPTTLNFGTVAANKSKTMSLVAKNSGPGVLHLTVSSSGLAAPFTAGFAAGQFTVLKGKTLSLKVVFAPTTKQSAPFIGTIVIGSDDPKHSSVTVTVSGSSK
jgi:subtilase family serine protease